jgi:zinc transport system ATP-binding protein
MTEIATLTNISMSFDGNKILYDVNMSIKEGEIITIIGPNGSGKSTLAKILIGLIKPTSGSRIIKENIKLAYMPQKLVINQQLPITVKRFLQLNSDSQDQIENICKELEIDNIISRQMSELSGGEMQRVLLARCLLSSPDLLVLDEPMQGVDLNGQIWFYKSLAKFRDERKISIVIISHDLHMVMKATDKVLCLNHHICCFGTPGDLLNDPAYLKTFGHDSLETMAIYSHHHDHIHTSNCNTES